MPALTTAPAWPALEALHRFKMVKDKQAVACCPAHHDTNPSLGISIAEDGKILVICRSGGCTLEQVATALNLTVRDFFPAKGGREGGGGNYSPRTRATPQHLPKCADKSKGDAVAITAQQPATAHPSDQQSGQPPEGCTVAAYAEAKRLPVSFLRQVGLFDLTYPKPSPRPAVGIPYYGLDGRVQVTTQYRLLLQKPEGPDTRFAFKKGTKPALYGQWRLHEARQAGAVTIVEGASDCHTLWFQGFPALGIPGAGNWKEERDAPLLDGISVIYVVIEPDTGGEAVKQWLGKSRIRERVRLVSLGAYKDPSALYLAGPNAFKARWQAALDAAISWATLDAAARAQQAQDMWETCKDLAKHESILDMFAESLAAAGVAGEARVVKLVYLAVTSRLTDHPVSVAVKGQSSAGKSYTTERVLGYFPATAFYALSAMSERALAYSDEPLAHRLLVIYEAAGMKGEWATYLLRSLLSEGRVRYETVEKTSDGSMRSRLIEREGPTGLLVTTTEVALHAENETRLLSIQVTDTPEQTRAILRAQANEQRDQVDLEPWLALQTWLESAEHRVTIPYAQALADEIPPIAVRLRRDFPQVLTLIRAHTLLHQASRERDTDGRVVATLSDYAAVRELVYDIVADAVDASVSPAIRETVNAVAMLASAPRSNHATVAQVAAALKLDKSGASRRVRQAQQRGYLKNLEERKGMPAQLVINDPMPDDQVVLPTIEMLRDRCAVAVCCNEGATMAAQDMPGWRGGRCAVAPEARGHQAPPSEDVLTMATREVAEWTG